MLEDGGHTWPGSPIPVDIQRFGNTSHAIDANEAMYKFFMDHPRTAACRTVHVGEACYDAVTAAMKSGTTGHPEWQGRLSVTSSFEDYQTVLHEDILADCPRPCETNTIVEVPTATTTTTTGTTV